MYNLLILCIYIYISTHYSLKFHRHPGRIKGRHLKLPLSFSFDRCDVSLFEQQVRKRERERWRERAARHLIQGEDMLMTEMYIQTNNVFEIDFLTLNLICSIR